MNYTRTICLLLALIFCATPLFACQAPGTEEIPPLRDGGMRLALNGTSEYAIVISKEASADVQAMAEEFVSYFRAITGATLDILTDDKDPVKKEIVIGKTTRKIDSTVDYDALGQEDFIYQTQDENLLLTGKSDRAVAYAVYGFLEDRLGVRYYTPDLEYVPQKDVLDVAKKISATYSPTFWYRDMSEIGNDDPEWMVKMRLNSRQSLGSENYQKYPAVGGGEGYADWYVHTIGKLAEMEPNQEGNHKGTFMNLQPCLTDENTYQTVLKNIRKWMQLYPESTLLSVSQNDGSNEGAMCTCENCRKIYEEHGNVQSALWIWFVSRVANELRDEFPALRFETLAYNFTTLAPIGLEIPDNVVVRVVPAHGCLNHPYAQCAAANGCSFQKMSLKFVDNLPMWDSLCKNIFVWDYSALFYNYWAPLNNFEVLRQNMNYYAENGVKGVFMQGGDQNSCFGEMRAYLTAKLLWEPSMNEATYLEHMEEFCEFFYGPGTYEPLKEYIDFYQEAIKEDHYSLYGTLFGDISELYVTQDDEGTHLDTSVMIDPMNEFFDRAEAGVTEQMHKDHLEKARVQVTFFEVIALFKLTQKYEDAVVDEAYRTSLNEKLYAALKKHNFKGYSEGGRLPDDPDLTQHPAYW